MTLGLCVHVAGSRDNGWVRSQASIMHLDLDAFFAAVEQRDKPSLRGKPVIVGGVGPRGVVSTASYEAREFGVGSAMPSHEARRRCPHAAFLAGRFDVYRAASQEVMQVLRELSPLVEPLSLDEAFVDLAAADRAGLDSDGVAAFARDVKRRIAGATGGLSASIGIGSSKFIAKLATEIGKPDGLTIVPPGTEISLISPMSVRAIPGVGPATGQRLRRLGIETIAQLQAIGGGELAREIGSAHAHGLKALAYAEDDRPVQPERAAKSISVEDTFDTDLSDRDRLVEIIGSDAAQVAERLTRARLLAHTITIKVRLHGFVTHTRSRTLSGPTDRTELIGQIAQTLLDEIDIGSGVRLLGVGVAGLTDGAQQDLFTVDPAQEDAVEAPDETREARDQPDELHQPRREWVGGDDPELTAIPAHAHARQQPDAAGEAGKSTDHAEQPGAGKPTHDAERMSLATSAADVAEHHRHRRSDWPPGADVEHAGHGRGWVWGSGRGLVTVRFETADSPPGPVHTFATDDPALHRI
jgi:DNA polymerase-4